MDGPSFKARLKLLGRTQIGFAEENGVALRTVHNWAASGPPPGIERLLDLMMLVERPFDAPHRDPGPDAFRRSVLGELDRLAEAAGPDRRDTLVQSIQDWLATASNRTTSSRDR